MKRENDKFEDDMFTLEMKNALKSLHTDALVECDHTFIDRVEDDLAALKRSREYQKIVEFTDMRFPPDEPIHNLQEYAMYMQDVIMPMLRKVTRGAQ